MKNIFKFIVFTSLTTMVTFSCKHIEIETYEGKACLNFVKKSVDTTFFSFAFHPGISEYTLNIPVELIGNTSSKDRLFKVDVVEEVTTAVESTDYEILESVFHANNYVDSLSVIIKRTDDIDDGWKTLVLEIVDGRDFQQGFVDATMAMIRFTAKIAKPDWWTDEIVANSLGEYSDEKYTAFILATGVSDLTFKPDEGMCKNKIRSLCRVFRKWLEQKKIEGDTQKEKDGSDIVIALID